MSANSSRHRNKIGDAVNFFSKFISIKPKLSNTVELQLHLAAIEEESVSRGLEADHLPTLVDVAACGHLAQKWSLRLVKALIPKTTVPESAVMKAVSWMCTNKPPIVVQSLLIRWILVVYDYIDEIQRLHNLYGILFYFLENQVLLPHVCHLLYLLTRKDDVRMFRVSKLIQLQKQMGTQPYLTGLLSIYQVYYPNLVTLPLRSTNIIFFKSYDRNWSSIVRKVKEGNADKSLNQSTEREYSRNKRADLSARAPASKRRRRELIPQISASTCAVGDRTPATEKVSLSLDVARIPMIQISSFMDMVDKIDRIEIPSQICAALRDPLLQHIVAQSGDKVIASRFSYWIQHTLVEELLNSSGVNEEAEKLLQHLICFMDFLQEGIPAVDTFLRIYLNTWNGVHYRPYVMRLIGKMRMQPFSDLKDLVLEPIRKLFFTSSVYFKCQVMLTLTDLTQNYAAIELFRYRDCLNQQASQGSISSQASEYSLQSYLSLFSQTVEKYDPMHTLQELVKWVLSIANVGLIAENDNTLLMYHVISYIELLSTMNQKYDVPFLYLPSDLLISRIILSDSTLACTKLCSILCNYKTSFQALRSFSEQTNPQVECVGLAQVPQFNSIVIDMCNCLSRNKLHDAKLGLGVSMTELVDDVEDVTLPQSNGAFSIYKHQSFAGFARSFWKQIHPPDVKFNPSHIGQTQAQKQAYLDYLKKEGLVGVVQFLTMFLRKHSTSTC